MAKWGEVPSCKSERDCCKAGRVWVNKYSDLSFPTVEQDGRVNHNVTDFVDIHIFVCRFCGEAHAETG